MSKEEIEKAGSSQYKMRLVLKLINKILRLKVPMSAHFTVSVK